MTTRAHTLTTYRQPGPHATRLALVAPTASHAPLRAFGQALASFGPDRCMFGGNWFVPVAFDGRPYRKTAEQVAAALARTGATDAAVRKVFADTARRVYGIR